MKILLSNDDGYRADGLRCLQRALADVGDVTVVAPDRNRSGASHSLTLDAPIRVRCDDDGVFCVTGTPTDCVHLAVTGLVSQEPDIVVSGINAGPNLGDDVLYSGTVAAAMEGRFLGLPAIAVSLASQSPTHYQTAADVVCRLLSRVAESGMAANTIFNVNVPDCPLSELKGMVATRMGHRHRAEPIVRKQDPHGRPTYWVGGVGEPNDGGLGTDFAAIRDGYVSVTPLQVDLTRHESLPALDRFLGELFVSETSAANGKARHLL